MFLFLKMKSQNFTWSTRLPIIASLAPFQPLLHVLQTSCILSSFKVCDSFLHQVFHTYGSFHYQYSPFSFPFLTHSLFPSQVKCSLLEDAFPYPHSKISRLVMCLEFFIPPTVHYIIRCILFPSISSALDWKIHEGLPLLCPQPLVQCWMPLYAPLYLLLRWSDWEPAMERETASHRGAECHHGQVN